MRRAISVYGLIFPAIFAVAFAVQWQRTDTDRDVAIYYRAAMQAGEPGMYEPLPLPGPITRKDIPLYPPPLFAALRPFAELPYVWFTRLWLVLVAVGFWAFASACARIATGSYGWRSVLAVGGLLFFVPGVIQSWNMLNVDVLLWACVALGLAHAGTRRGAYLASGVVLKVMPVWALLFALRERNVWRGMLWVGLASVAFLLTLGMAGISECWTWLTRIAPVIAAGEVWAPDHTFMVGPWALPSWLAPDRLRIPGGPAVNIGVPLLAGFLTRKRTVSEQAAAVLGATLLAAPILRINYLPMLVPCVLIVIRQRVEGPSLADPDRPDVARRERPDMPSDRTARASRSRSPHRCDRAGRPRR